MAELTIKLTEKMVFDRQHCYEDSDCSECSCCMANDECLFNFREERKVGKWIDVHSTEYKEFSVTDMKCNRCNRYASLVLPHGTTCTYDFCPNCNADMRGAENG